MILDYSVFSSYSWQVRMKEDTVIAYMNDACTLLIEARQTWCPCFTYTRTTTAPSVGIRTAKTLRQSIIGSTQKIRAELLPTRSWDPLLSLKRDPRWPVCLQDSSAMLRLSEATRLAWS